MFVAPAKRYKVLVGSEVIYCGSWRTAHVVYVSVSKTVKLVSFAGSDPVLVTLAFDI